MPVHHRFTGRLVVDRVGRLDHLVEHLGVQVGLARIEEDAADLDRGPTLALVDLGQDRTEPVGDDDLVPRPVQDGELVVIRGVVGHDRSALVLGVPGEGAEQLLLGDVGADHPVALVDDVELPGLGRLDRVLDGEVDLVGIDLEVAAGVELGDRVHEHRRAHHVLGRGRTRIERQGEGVLDVRRHAVALRVPAVPDKGPGHRALPGVAFHQHPPGVGQREGPARHLGGFDGKLGHHGDGAGEAHEGAVELRDLPGQGRLGVASGVAVGVGVKVASGVGVTVGVAVGVGVGVVTSPPMCQSIWRRWFHSGAWPG